MPNSRRIGIIDIGSNSIRLVIYEMNQLNAYRVIGEFKQSARLSQRIGPDNSLPPDDVQAIVGILSHFKQVCNANQVSEIRAAATAAIRNAANSQHIIQTLHYQTGIEVELLSGEDEARLGFLGMINSLDIPDGIVVDIGGGSTEVTIFRNRTRLKSVSFPFGAVNTGRRFSTNGDCSEEQLKQIRHMVQEAVANEPWIKMHPGLPFIGLGGTIRSLSKINQKKQKYSLPVTHNYPISALDMDELMQWLSSLPNDKRKKVDGLSKERFDIIVPGMTLLQALFEATGSSHYVISGAGLRDGLFHEAFLPDHLASMSLLDHSARNLLALHSTAPVAHLEQVTANAAILFNALQSLHGLDDRSLQVLRAAALLHRIGVAVNYYHFVKHSFYLIAHSRIDGLSHRETLICAAAATYKTKNKTQQIYLQHKDILSDTDLDLIAKLGTILQLAIALDISEAQSIASFSAIIDPKDLLIHAQIKNDPSFELRGVESVQKEFSKIWGLKPVIQTS
ncbi:Ppx/GppA family phosphatase [Paenibacillus sp. LMG 31456]|uniref:Chaperone protein DnaK n=1 Tax=Paenibacillus foliorum TaxID=2654974 RepID=A0A972JZY9_9BACL|nr:Ppx/GppA phosphatase family protein [Paenibacillus foliorum]NOU92348.1 Ppx/GppA family phosphatase [Paenibacillus foliorum]